MVPVDAVAPADAVDYYDDRHAHDAYNDARYGKHVHDGVLADAAHPADVALRVDAAVQVDAVVPVQMHRFLITGINMRRVVVS